MTTSELRAESEMVQSEAGGEMTTRAAMLLGAADELDRLRDALERIRRHTDPNPPKENYRQDDREGCLDTVFNLSHKALTESGSVEELP